MTDRTVTALIADDEPLLATSLQTSLAKLWPQLDVVATVHNGSDALAELQRQQPDVAFLDIRMPGATGLEVAETIANDWPEHTPPCEPPLMVFVTAFDDYAVQAFNAAAVDYLLKPVTEARLNATIERLKQRLLQPNASSVEQLGAQIRSLLNSEANRTAAGHDSELRVIRASVGDKVKMIPIDEVIMFEAADKYVTVHTAAGESLIREPLKKLLGRLDQQQFVRIHRSAIVNLQQVEAAIRDDSAKVTLRLKGSTKQPVVSRVYRHLFVAM